MMPLMSANARARFTAGVRGIADAVQRGFEFDPRAGDICFRCRAQWPRMKRCARCHFATYCGRGCQALDWPAHKAFCNETVAEDKARAAAAGKA